MFNPLLTSFVCVADSGSFNRAAEKLYISSTAVIKQVNALEKHLALQLFVRTNHGVRLTAAGQVIYRCAKQMFEESARAVAEARCGRTCLPHVLCRHLAAEPLQTFYRSVVPSQRPVPGVPAAHCSL